MLYVIATCKPLLLFFIIFILKHLSKRGSKIGQQHILSYLAILLFFISYPFILQNLLLTFLLSFRFYFDYYYFFFFLYLYLFREGVITILNKLFLSLSLIFFSLWIFFCKFIDIKMTRKKVKIYEMSIIIQIASKTHFLEVFVL